MRSKRKKKKIGIIVLTIVLVVIVVVSLIIAFGPDIKIEWKSNDNQNNQSTQTNQITQETKPQEKVKIVEIKKDPSVETTEKQAKDATVKQFKNLGEEVTQEELKVDMINRKGEKFYYIKSKEHSIMISVDTGKIVRIDSVSL